MESTQHSPEVGPVRAPRPGLLGVLRNPNFSRLYIAGIASVGGATIGETCLLWIVYSSTHSAFDVALYGVSFLLAGVSVSLIAGVVVDRYNRKRIMILADVSRAVTVGVLFALLLVLGFHLSIVLGAVALVAAFSTLFIPAQNTIIPRVVGGDSVADANGLVQSSNSLIQFAGNGAAGVLIATLGATAGLGLNSLTFVISAMFVASMALPVATAEESRQQSIRRQTSYAEDLRLGFRYLRSQVGLLELTISAGFGNFFITIVLGFEVVYVTGPLRGGSTIFGLVLGLFALGSGLGALTVGRVGAVRYTGWIWILGSIVQGFVILGLSRNPGIGPTLVLVTVIGFLLGLMNTAWLSTAQVIVPTEMQGRYFGIDQLGSFAIIPVAQVTAAFLIDARGILWAYGFAGAGLLLVGVVFLFAADLRRLRVGGPAHRSESLRGPP